MAPLYEALLTSGVRHLDLSGHLFEGPDAANLGHMLGRNDRLLSLKLSGVLGRLSLPLMDPSANKQ